ncbi:MAG: BON domain-containing protein [Acidobacteriaceae bacterium]|nr:BON domain-containing protein [Acidobacteriaceae bacterium]
MQIRSSRLLTAVFALLFALALSLPGFAEDSATKASLGKYDAQIQADVNKKLQDKDKLRDVRATVQDGIVTLTGNVKLFRDKLQADHIAHHVEHAQGVRNEISVLQAGGKDGQTMSDQQLREKLAERLRYDRVDQGVTFNNFALDVNHGVVTVNGEARSPVDKDSALSIIENTPGVVDVVDNIKVLPVSPMDDELRLRVARAIYGYPALQKYAIDPQSPIRIVVENGKVTLYGVVDSQMDKQLAEMQANQVPGVFSVTDRLVVAGQTAQK